jgi:hypothetical protein
MDGFNAAIIAAAPPIWFHSMQWVTMWLICCNQSLAERALQRPWLNLGSVSSACICSHSLHRVISAHNSRWTMKRLRGKPRRGSAWKPRRPSLSRSDSSSLSSSSRSQSGHLSLTSRRTVHAQSMSWALVPRTISPPPRQPCDPRQSGDPEPDPPQTSRGAGPLPRDSFNSAQLWDSLAALYDLVFGIRQGMDDLNFRLQDTDVKVDLFLRTLTSLQDSLAPGQNEDSSMQEPNPAKEEAADAKKDKDTGATSGSKVDATATDGDGDKCWNDQSTYIAEELWTEDIQPKWPNYSPYV